MVDFIQKGGLYDYAQDKTLVDWGVLARGASWDQVMIAARDALQAQAAGLYPPDFKLRIWKSLTADDFAWCVKWVPRQEQAPWDAHWEAP